MHVLLFLDVSGGELLVILLFVLLFFGSKGVPEVARTMGRAMRQLRDASAELQREIEKGASEVKKGFDEQRNTFRMEPPEQAIPRQDGPKPAVPAKEPDAAAAPGGKAAETGDAAAK